MLTHLREADVLPLPLTVHTDGDVLQETAVEAEIKHLEKTLALLKFKCWYYETAMADGSEENLNAMLPDNLPPQIQALYDKGHE